ncbi:hypothetical protein BDV41DRAFT_572173 [Aspergillus transmontanensis]|uniref:Nucleoside phosphorylase domain-containing protein n=1 Tax=Aspergillus transmontanensis TaxID=1034304 RepID=A0A5N6WBX8_9EURO|nr:hypothetical protein BDV41DRAFT_572173 [Aspergillus transmontanensis]
MGAGPQKYVYSFGRLGGHSLVIARPSQTGTVSAAQCAPNVSQQFLDVRFALVVGIGAGIPNPPTCDIRLGDISVGIPQDNHPGVIQYDFAKYEEDGYVLKGSLNKSPSILISADGSLEEDEIMDRSPFRKILWSITKKPRFKRPDTGDYLFKEDFNHIEEGRDCTECLASGTAKFVLRDMRRRKDPVVHRGLILSGSGVIKKPQDRQAIQDDPQICEKPLQIQFEKLLFRPILGLNLDPIRDVITVLDALDECEDDDIKLILQLLPKLQQAKAVKKSIALHEIPEMVIKCDKLLFLEHRFSEIKEESFLRGRVLPPDWPGKDALQSIATLSVPSFIFVVALCRFVGDKKWTPETRLAAIFKDPAIDSASEMERVYLPILNQAIFGQTEREEKQLVQEFQAIDGAIIILDSPLSVNALEQLLDIPQNDIKIRLDSFRSVLEIPESPDMSVRLLHASFRDFLLILTRKQTVHSGLMKKERMKK